VSSSNKDENFNKTNATLPEVDEINELEESLNPDKMKVECICPKCGQKHTLSFHWIGRGTPRKFCQACKGIL
jgi:hypothetical protein